ncbi:MAG: EamA family transporter [Ornithinimicrobium sp.]
MTRVQPALAAASATGPRVPWQAKFVALAVIWGSSYLLMKVGLQAMDGVQVAALRLVCAAVVLLPLLIASGGRLPRGGHAWKHIAVSGTLLCSLPWTLFAVGEERVTSSITGIANATTPIAAVLFGMVMLRHERIGRARIVGVGVGFVGVVLIAQPWSLDQGPDPVGMAMVLVASASYGLGWTYVRRYMSGIDAGGLALPTAQILLATAQMPFVLLLWWLVAGGDHASPVSLHTTESALIPVLAVIFLGIVGTGLGQAMQYDVVRAAGATVASSVAFVIPVVAVLLGFVILGETVAPAALLGGGLILYAARLVTRTPKPSP